MEKASYILKEYLNYHNESIQKYGENTVVLMQVGGFYEIYAVVNETTNVGADIYQLADILGIQVARRNKNIPTIGLAFSFQKFNKIKTSKFDVKLNYILTEKGIF